MAIFEDLIDETGGMGRFQVLLLLGILSCDFTIGWSMLQMSFARATPDYICIIGNSSSDSYQDQDLLNVCKINGTKCSAFKFIGHSRTVTSEWSLVCDHKWVQSTIISIQMVGVLIGALTSGQLCDAIGRKKVLYSFVMFHIICNFITAASSTWIMFAAMRFFIGIAMGAILVVSFPYPMEFLPIKWRPLLGIIPIWSTGVGLFAAGALILDDWAHLHIACAIVSMPSLLGFVFVPESIRWLTLKGKIDEAQNVLNKIAEWNNKTVPIEAKLKLIQVEKTEREANMKRIYSFNDLFKGWKRTKISLSLWYFWFIMSVTFYGISFGVSSLHGNTYLNIFILGVIEIPIQTTTFFTNNRFGRKKSSVFFFSLGGLATLGCLLSDVLSTGSTRGIAINVFCMTTKAAIGSAWSCVQVWGSELYPTVTRGLGYSFASCGARVGAILSPFLIQLDTFSTLSYSILTGMLVIAVAVCFILPETKGKSLYDSQSSNTNGNSNLSLNGNYTKNSLRFDKAETHCLNADEQKI